MRHQAALQSQGLEAPVLTQFLMLLMMMRMLPVHPPVGQGQRAEGEVPAEGWTQEKRGWEWGLLTLTIQNLY